MCDQKIHDLECLLQEKSSSVTRCSEKIDNMNDILQTYERRLDELEVENKSLEDKLREQESKIDQLNINLVATELKLKESVSQVADLCAEVEVKTVYGSQLREVSFMLSLLCATCTLLLPLIWANKLLVRFDLFYFFI